MLVAGRRHALRSDWPFIIIIIIIMLLYLGGRYSVSSTWPSPSVLFPAVPSTPSSPIPGPLMSITPRQGWSDIYIYSTTDSHSTVTVQPPYSHLTVTHHVWAWLHSWNRQQQSTSLPDCIIVILLIYFINIHPSTLCPTHSSLQSRSRPRRLSRIRFL